MSMKIWTLAAVLASTVVAGCPTEPDAPPTLENVAGSEAISKAIAAAQAMEDLQPVPSHETLCSLQFGYALYGEVKQLLGEPAEESMNRSMAGLSYRFRGGISMTFTFEWAHNDLGFERINTPDPGDRYMLKDASVDGMPYPACWPHESPE